MQISEKKNTNLGSVTAVNGKNSATPQNMDHGKFLPLPPPPTESIRAKLGLPPQMDVGPYAYACNVGSCIACWCNVLLWLVECCVMAGAMLGTGWYHVVLWLVQCCFMVGALLGNG